MDDDELPPLRHIYTIGEAAKILGVKYHCAWRWCMRGLIDAERIGGVWRVPAMSLETAMPKAWRAYVLAKRAEGEATD